MSPVQMDRKISEAEIRGTRVLGVDARFCLAKVEEERCRC
jgi:hypothetical protein